MEVQRPDWWPYPERCEHGHEWGLTACWWCGSGACARAQMLHEDEAIWGHFAVACRERGCRSVRYDQPHEQRPPG